jgi:hypothetical protein
MVDPHRERVGEARDRMRRLQHLARVLRMEVRIVVAQPFRDLVQDLTQRGGIVGCGVERRQRLEALLEPRERVVQKQQGIRVEPAGHSGR